MKKTFLNHENPLLTVMLQCKNPDVATARIEKALAGGADAFGLQIESLLPEYHNEETYRALFDAMGDKPCYVTNYRTVENLGKDDETLAREMLGIAKCGATLCDVMGDMFSRHPDELTDDPEAIRKQMEYIDALHEIGAEVLMSSHLTRFLTGEEVLRMALEQKRRGADFIKIVTFANDINEQLENLRTTALLKKELGAPFLFLAGGECSIHRRLGINIGCSMALCVYEHDEFSTPVQPLLCDIIKLKNCGF